MAGAHPMGSENPFELSTDAFERGARTLVTRGGVKADTEHLPRFEGKRQHKQLGFSVNCSPDCRAGQPSIADLTRVEDVAGLPRGPLCPPPPLRVPEPGRPNDPAVIHLNNCEWHRAASVLPSQRGFDVVANFDLALRDGTPPVQRGVSGCGGCQAVDVAAVKRFETNVRAR